MDEARRVASNIAKLPDLLSVKKPSPTKLSNARLLRFLDHISDPIELLGGEIIERRSHFCFDRLTLLRDVTLASSAALKPTG